MEDLAKEINSRPHLLDAFDFSEISNGHLSNLGRGNANLHAGEVGYFKDETKGNPIVEFVGLRRKMYSFTVCDASEPIPRVNYPMDVRHKAVAKGRGAVSDQALQARGLRAHVTWWSPDKRSQSPNISKLL